MAPVSFLHRHPDFSELLRIVAEQKSIDPALVEKDYWIMHCLYGLQDLGMRFELKGGTSLSKGYGIIHRFSEDVDIRIEPPAAMHVMAGKNHDKPAHRQGRREFFDWLAENIKMDGVDNVQRDTAYDDEKFRNGGIRLHYESSSRLPSGLKEGILLEVGFDEVAPNEPKDITSWAFDFASGKVPVIDNRAKAVACYHPGYTFVEKLQTISTKYRMQQEAGSHPANFMRHYYDLYCLLQDRTVLSFIGTPDYRAHKKRRFRSGDNPIIAENEAFLLSDPVTRSAYENAYLKSGALYYRKQPVFDEILTRFRAYADRL